MDMEIEDGNDDIDGFLREAIVDAESRQFDSVKVFPGDIITNRIEIKKGSNIKIGKGLTKTKSNDIVCTVAGLLKHRTPNTYWIEPTAKMIGDGGYNKSARYNPMLNDHVIGIIEEKTMEYYKININFITFSNV